MTIIRSIILKFYYFLKPVIPRSFQFTIRKIIGKQCEKVHKDDWPIDHDVNKSPHNWNGWPGNKKIAVVLRHDVESEYGLGNIWKLIEIEEKIGFKSSFNFPPERYEVPEKIISEIKGKGFEVGLHGLKHDGKLFCSKREFQKRAARINKYLTEWNITGFVSPSSLHNFEWISQLDISYDSSSFDTDPFEPQPDAVGSIFPFTYTSEKTGRNFIELPYTLPQDSTLFIILGKKNIDIWKSKIDWIVENKGMVLLNTHPDYMSFNSIPGGRELYPHDFYKEILEYINKRYYDQFINFLPSEIADFWIKRESEIAKFM